MNATRCPSTSFSVPRGCGRLSSRNPVRQTLQSRSWFISTKPLGGGKLVLICCTRERPEHVPLRLPFAGNSFCCLRPITVGHAYDFGRRPQLRAARRLHN